MLMYENVISGHSSQNSGHVVASRQTTLHTRVSMRYGEIIHKLKATEMSRNISRKRSVTSDLSYIDGKCVHAVE